MPRATLKIGDKFNKLTVESFAKSDINGHIRVNVLCECGKRRTVRATYVKTGHTRSCGCLQKENRA